MGLIANLLELLKGNTTEDSKKLSYGRIASVEGWPGYDPNPVAPGTRYIQLWLEEMWLKRAREWLNEFYPMAYSVTTVQFGDATVTLPTSLGEFSFDGDHDFSNLSRALRVNYAMTPVLPYNGGIVELRAALVSIRHAAGLKDAISAVNQFSKLLNVPQLSAVVSVAGPFADTLDALLVGGRQGLILGLHQSFKHGGEEEIEAGYYITANKEDVRFSDLVVDNGLLRWKASRQQVREFDYMLFRLEVSAERDDYHGLKAIYDPMVEAENAAKRGDTGLDEAKAWVTTAKLAAWRSLDLTAADRKRMPAVLQQEFDDYLTLIGVGGGGAGAEALPTKIETKERLRRGVTADEALAMPDRVVVENILSS